LPVSISCFRSRLVEDMSLKLTWSLLIAPQPLDRSLPARPQELHLQ
jgi:hypothetical protein